MGLHIQWSDCNKLRHQGRLYESRETHSTTVDVPDTIHSEDVNVQWDGKTVIIALPKPAPKKKESQALALQAGDSFMRIPLPPDSNHCVDIQVKGNQLIASVEVEASHADGSSSYPVPLALFECLKVSGPLTWKAEWKTTTL